MTGALSGLRVLDLTRYIPGPYCTAVLADLGADVVKVEEPGLGDPVRALAPARGAESTLHAALNRHKRSIAVDLRTTGGAEVVRRLAAEVDVLVESFRPGTLDRSGLGAELLLARNPRLVYCSISGYGRAGPLADRAGHDVNYAARSGLLAALRGGDDGRLPLVQVADMAGGLYAVIAILAALVARGRTGRGQRVDASMMGGAMGLLTVPLARMLAGGEADELGGSHACYGVYPCADGQPLAVGALEPKFWQALTRVLGLPDLAGRQWPGPAQAAAVRERVAAAFRGRTREDWLRAFEGEEACVEPVLHPREAATTEAAAPFLRAQAFDDGTLPAVAAPFALSETPLREPGRAPALGEHTDTVLAGAGYAADEVQALRASGAVG